MASNDSSKLDNKLDYLTNTKALIRQALSNKGAIVDDNKTFREYADVINNLEVQEDQSDANATPNDIVKGKIAYVDNNKVVGTLAEYRTLTATAFEVTENDTQVIGKCTTDDRLLLESKGSLEMQIDHDKIPSYKQAMNIVNDILDEEE